MLNDSIDPNGLEDLYQQMILDHSRRPRNLREMTDATGSGEGYNPLCGDRVMVFVKIDAERVTDVSFVGKGCAICTASASMMTECIKGHSTQTAQGLFKSFHGMLTDSGGDGNPDLDKLVVFEGVRKYPIRVKCATLPWHTLKAALASRDQIVSTE